MAVLGMIYWQPELMLKNYVTPLFLHWCSFLSLEEKVRISSNKFEMQRLSAIIQMAEFFAAGSPISEYAAQLIKHTADMGEIENPRCPVAMPVIPDEDYKLVSVDRWVDENFSNHRSASDSSNCSENPPSASIPSDSDSFTDSEPATPRRTRRSSNFQGDVSDQSASTEATPSRREKLKSSKKRDRS
eukprot:Platyproteum_vivax@DN6408_c0_g1_i1.p2